MNDTTKTTKDNCTWVTLAVPIAPDALFEFLKNTERLFRLNPYLDIRKWEGRPEGKQHHLEALNELNGVMYHLDLNLESLGNRHFFLRYSQGLKASLEVAVESATDSNQAILTLREHYHQVSIATQEQQLKEIDHSLIPWGKAIVVYIRGMQRWGWFWPYRWYQEKFWLGMRPTHRRIARLIAWVTLLEFVVFLFVFIIYFLEFLR